MTDRLIEYIAERARLFVWAHMALTGAVACLAPDLMREYQLKRCPACEAFGDALP